MSASLGRLSFIGRRPINFRKDQVSLKISDYLSNERSFTKFGKLPFKQTVTVSGQLGSFNVNLFEGLRCKIEEGLSPEESQLKVEIDADKFESFNKYQKSFLKSMYGTTNSILMSFVEGVSEGHQVNLQLVGVGYKAAVEGSSINLRLGFSHPIILPIPENIQARVVNQTKIVLTGPNLQQVTQFAAKIRSHRPPEPYNGKGIFVDGETVIRKEGKKTK